MIKKILFLTLVISLVILAGCRELGEFKEKTSDPTGDAIEEAETEYEAIEDTAVEEELDNIEDVLSDW